MLESIEQLAIEKSVTIDRERKKVLVTLPFKEYSVPRLKGKHKGSDNFHSPKQVYLQQCRKPDATKEKMRIVHKELGNKKFMIRLRNLPDVKRKFIVSFIKLSQMS